MAGNAHPLNKLTLAPSATENDAQIHEDQYVHTVYDQIAPHFSQTRYKPWPVITKFLESVPTGAIGLDAGTGNGKYLPLSEGRYLTMGVDRSIGLLKFAQYAGESPMPRDVILGDVRDLIWRNGIFDFAISIATVHHLATPERRVDAIVSILNSLVPGGKALIYVWAVEQDELSKRVVPDMGEDNASSAKVQDVLVPWVMQQENKPKPKTKTRRGRKVSDNQGESNPTSSPSQQSAEQTDVPVFQRYYHLFVSGELTELATVAAAKLELAIGPVPVNTCVGGRHHGVCISPEGWERSNLYVELTRWSK
ncbi:S-adenosyl-L-methionine-dependent methyltransferase, putative [Rhizoctonia solani AG-3 Rhs1AP]|uniref:S-adenosyl-L-methionine-dependent methyltransferase, putative n=1 Tax=Rhizoctonia solani AG-3 Rhs1AP TaxID=1086054 RepID=X8J7E9_9AGAM|nr:S-adenosyl-L-methionine-dependent methyltransferase, putative [Rhizoctonia solani AG-3 Rhs1AP]